MTSNPRSKPGREKHRRRGPAPTPIRRASSDAPVRVITLALLFAVPVFFVPGRLPEEFEFVKVMLLVTGGLLLAAWWVAAESSRIGSAGFVSWLRALPHRGFAAIRRDPLGGAVALMLLSAVVSTLTSIRPTLSVFGAPQSRAGLETIAAMAALYFASRSLASDPLWIRRVAQAAGMAAAVAAGYALLQAGHLDPLKWSRQSSFGGLIRAGSTVGHANTLSAYMVMCLPLAIWLATRARPRAGALGWLALAAVSLFIAVASLSRGAWLGLAGVTLAAAVLLVASGRLPSWKRALAVGAIALVAMLLPFVTPMRAQLLQRVHELTDLKAETTRTRVELWRAGMSMFHDHPAVGAGLDAYLAAFPRYRTATLTEIEWGGTPAKAHNDWIQILATQGALGGLAALAIVILGARAVWRIATRGSPELRGAAVAVGAAFVGYVLPSLVGFGTVATSGLAAALAGWSARAARNVEANLPDGASPVRQDAPQQGRPVGSAWNLVAGFALAAGLGYVLVVRPLAAEIALARATHFPAGSAEHEDALEQAASSAPWDPRYPAELGRSLFVRALQQSDPHAIPDILSQAEAALRTSVRAAPENGENRILLASVLSTQVTLEPDRYPKERVAEEFRRAVALDPMSPIVLVSAARGLMAAGLDRNAHELALRAVRAYPNYALPYADLGAIALEAGRNADAADTLKLAVIRNWRGDESSRATSWNDLSRALYAMGKFPEAADAADSALAHNPGLASAFGNKEAAKRAMGERGKGGKAAGEK